MHKVLLSLCFPQLIFPWVLVFPLLLSSRPRTLLLAASFLAVMRPFHLPCNLPAVIHHAVLLGRLVFLLGTTVPPHPQGGGLSPNDGSPGPLVGWAPHNSNLNSREGGMFARRAPCALLLDYVPPEEPPSTPLGNALRIRWPKLKFFFGAFGACVSY